MTTAPILFAVKADAPATTAIYSTYDVASKAAQRLSQKEPKKLFLLYRMEPIEAFIEQPDNLKSETEL